MRCINQAGSPEYAPAPFAPTRAIRESNPISMFTFFRRIFSGVYPNVTSFNCKRGGDILSVSGNLSIRQTNPRGSRIERGILEALRVLRLGRFQIGKFLQDFDSCLCLCGYNRASAQSMARKRDRLTSICVVSPPIDKLLQALPVQHLSFVLFALVPLSFGLCGIELGEVTVVQFERDVTELCQSYEPPVVIKSAGVLMYNVSCHCVTA